ncbi:hypothetical protein [Caminibacter sp.]
MNNDPYSNQGAPYSNNSYNSRLGRDNVFANDPYRQHDPYKHNDPYRHHDPYKHHDPYQESSMGYSDTVEGEKERFSFFWFWLKREIQMLFNAEAGSQEQDLIYPIEEDFMKLRIATKFFVRNMISFFLTITGFWIPFILLSQISDKYGNIIFLSGIIYFFLLAYLLYLPTHQIVSSFEYTVFKNVKNFYKRIASLFSSYRNSIIVAIIINIAVGAIFVYKPDLLYFVVKKESFTFEFFKKENVKAAFNVLAISSVFSLILYVFFYKIVFSVAQKNRKEHIKAFKRKKSEFYKHSSVLDED